MWKAERVESTVHGNRGHGPHREAVLVRTDNVRTVAHTASRAVRASDRDRDEVVHLLGEHTAAGRLSLAEFEERVSAAYAANLVAELDQLLTDLPAVSASRDPSSRRAGARAMDARMNRRLRGGAWAPWVLTGVICMLIWGLTSLGEGRWLYFWPVWVIGPWGAAMFCRVTWRGSTRSLTR